MKLFGNSKKKPSSAKRTSVEAKSSKPVSKEAAESGSKGGLIGMLEQKEDILNIISNSQKDTINILIGKENSVDIMSNSTLIFKTITANDKVVGAIGVIGPCRMDYSKVITTLDLLTDNIRGMFDIKSNLLNEGDNGGKND